MNLLEPGPTMVRFLSIVIFPAHISTVPLTPGANMIVLPAGASRMVCRNDPGPVSFVFVTSTLISTLSSSTVKSPEPLTMKATSRLAAKAMKGSVIFCT